MTQKIEVWFDVCGAVERVAIGGHMIEDVVSVATDTEMVTTIMIDKPIKITRPFTDAIVTKDEPRPKRAKKTK